MTQDEIKKALEICSDINLTCNDCPYDAVGNCTDILCADALKLIIEQEKSIQMAQDQILFVAQQNQEYREQQVKQAKIDVLNELKDKMFEREYMGVKYKERIFYESEIDDMIAEVQNAKDKG